MLSVFLDDAGEALSDAADSVVGAANDTWEFIEETANATYEFAEHALSEAYNFVEDVAEAMTDPIYYAYKLYMSYVHGGASNAYKIDPYLREALRHVYPGDLSLLEKVRIYHSGRVPGDGNSGITDCARIYFNDWNMVNNTKDAADYTSSTPLLRLGKGSLKLLLHELTHAEQCSQKGGRRDYANMWFGQMAWEFIEEILLRGDFGNITQDIHKAMSMEQDASDKAQQQIDSGIYENINDSSTITAFLQTKTLTGVNLCLSPAPEDVGFAAIAGWLFLQTQCQTNQTTTSYNINNVRQITANSATQWNPDISGSRIVWEDYRAINGDSDIYLYDLTTNKEKQITTDSSEQKKPAIQGDWIVWEDYRNGNSDIYLYDLITNIEKRITTSSANQSAPAIFGSRIVWEDDRNGNLDIYVYDLTTNKEERITTDSANQSDPAISGNRIVWQDDRNGNLDIYVYNFYTNTERQITTNSSQQWAPAISGDRIVWVHLRPGILPAVTDIYLYDLSANTEKQITADLAYQSSPSISGGMIVWADPRNGIRFSNWDVYGYDLAANTELEITRETPYKEGFPVIAGDKIVWADYRNGNWDIYFNAKGTKPVLASIGNKTVNENQILSFSISATDPEGDTLTYSAKGLPTGAVFNGQTFSWTPSYNQAGSYGVTFLAADSDGLADSETIAITVNNVNRAPVLAAIGNKSVNEGSSLTFTVSAIDDDGDTLTYSAMGLPSGATLNASTGAFSWTPAYSQAGSYNVTFTVSDGSLTDSETITITVFNHNRPPVLDAIGNKSVDEGTNLTFTVIATDPDGGTLTYSASGLPSGATFDSGTGIFSWTPAYSQFGSYNVTVPFIVSDDGSLMDSETITITVNNVNRAPVLDAIGDKSVDQGIYLDFTISATDPDGDTLAYSASGLPPDATFDGGARIFRWTPRCPEAGNYNVTFIASDGSLADTETITITVTNANQAPVLDAIGNKSVDEGSTLFFEIIATDPDDSNFLYGISTLLPGWFFFGGFGGKASLGWEPTYSQAGSYNVTFTVSDACEMDSETVTITVNNVDRAPVLSAIGNKSVDEGSNLTFTVSATDIDGEPLTYSASGLPQGAAFTTQTFAWTPDHNQSGSYNMTFIVSDGSLTDLETVTITVNNVNRAPVLDAIGNKSINEGSSLTFTVSATDPDGDTLDYSVWGLPPGATFNGGTRTFSWTPAYSQSGDYTVDFRASDGSLVDFEMITITVINVNKAPVFDAIGNKSVDVGSNLTFTVSATDPDGDSLTYSFNAFALEMPPLEMPLLGATFDSDTGTFNWTPAYSQSGNYTVDFRASDGSLIDFEMITITVINVNKAPVFDAIGNKSVDVGSNLTFTVSATDDDGDTLTYSASGLPSGAAFDGGTRIFSWTPAYSQVGSYNVIFAVTDGGLTTSETVTITVDNATGIEQITVNTASQHYPAISGNLIVWQDYRNGNWDIYLYDLSTDTETQITTNTATQYHPAISGNWIAWEDYRNGNYDIYLYDLSTDTEKPITTDAASQYHPAVSGDRIVWTDYRNGNWDIYLYDLSTDTERQITTNTASQYSPAISGDRIVWQDYRNGNYDIYLYDLSTDTEKQITTNTATQWSPTISGDRIIWQDSRNGNYDIYLYDLSTDTERQITADTSAQYSPTISDNWIAWYDFRDGDSDIYLYDLSTDTERQITVDTSQQYFPAVSGDRIVWTDYRNNNDDIYLYEDNKSPVLAAIGNKSVDEGSNLTFTVSATDDDGDTLTYSASGLPQGASFGGQTFNWTPAYSQSGIYPVTFAVSDGTLFDAETIIITVVDAADCPSMNMDIGSGLMGTFPQSNHDQTMTLTCPLGYTGAPARTCSYGTWGPLSNGCVPSNPDLIMTVVSAPATAVTGTAITISNTVKNQGNAAAGAFNVRLYGSADAAITTADTVISTRSISGLFAGASSSANTVVTIPTNFAAGTYYIGAIVDYANAVMESNEANNVSTAQAIVLTAGPDLVMTAVSGPASAARGASVTVSNTIKNQGVGKVTNSSSVGLYLSQDSVITKADTRVGTRIINSLAVGATSTASTTVVIPTTLTTGTYYLGVIADYTNTVKENNETNNALAGNTIAVQ